LFNQNIPGDATMSKKPDEALERRREFVAQIIETSRLLRNFIEGRARQAGTTRAQWIVLWRLREREGLSQVDLSEALELKPISLVRLLDRLVGQGWVERRQDIRDRRVNRLYLTAAGRRAVDDLDELSRAIITEVAGELSLDAIGGSIAALQQIKCRLKSKAPASARANAQAAGRSLAQQ
jgi:MarR family transcriptional regulator for hemolysin